MLDRLPTELISLVIDATSTRVWQRKALLDSMSSVSKSYRFAMRPLRERIVHVPRAAVIPLLHSWRTSTREAVDTVLIGPSDWHKALEPFGLPDYSALLSNLPNVKHVYLRRVLSQQSASRRVWLETHSSKPFRRELATFGP